jgi:hypothetical protein
MVNMVKFLVVLHQVAPKVSAHGTNDLFHVIQVGTIERLGGEI